METLRSRVRSKARKVEPVVLRTTIPILMNQLLQKRIALAFLLAFLQPVCELRAQQPGRPRPESGEPVSQRQGLLVHQEGAFSGYTLFAPLKSNTTYLIDMEGAVVHTWESTLRPGNAAYLLENGHLLRCAREPDNPVFLGGG